MHTSGHLDWLEMTYPFGTSPDDTLPRELLQSTLKFAGKGSHGYQARLTNDQGVSVMLDGSSAQGVHVTLPGGVLWNLRELGATDKSLCEYVTANSGKISRLDTAVNIHAGDMTIGDLELAYRLCKARTKAHHGLRISGVHIANDGLTVGSRVSERYFRAYDKRAESGAPGPRWIRLELEAKGNQAKNIASAIARSESARTVINKSIKMYVDFPTLDEYVAALADNDAAIDPVPRKLPAYLSWLMEQVAPSMAKYEREHPGVDTRAIINGVFEEIARAQRF